MEIMGYNRENFIEGGMILCNNILYFQNHASCFCQIWSNLPFKVFILLILQIVGGLQAFNFALAQNFNSEHRKGRANIVSAWMFAGTILCNWDGKCFSIACAVMVAWLLPCDCPSSKSTSEIGLLNLQPVSEHSFHGMDCNENQSQSQLWQRPHSISSSP